MARGQGSVSDIQSLVVDTLGVRGEATETKSKEPKLPFFQQVEDKQKKSLPELIESGRNLESFLQNADPRKDKEKIRLRVTSWAVEISQDMLPYTRKAGWRPPGGRVGENSAVLFMLQDFLSKPNKKNLNDIYNFVRSYTNAFEHYTIKSNKENRMDYLQDRWGDETAEKLHELTGASLTTTKKWVAGSNPSEKNKHTLEHIVEVIYTLENDCRMSPAAAEGWLYTDNPAIGGISPWEKLKSSHYRWSLDSDVAKALDALVEDVKEKHSI